MANVVSVQVLGLQQLGEALKELGEDMAKKIAWQATAAAANVIKKRAVAQVIANPSVDTGRLRDAIIVRRLPKNQTPNTAEHIVTVRGRTRDKRKGGRKSKKKQAFAPHAVFVEFGTVHMAKEPFLRPAYDSGKAEATEKMADRIRIRIAEVKAKGVPT